MQNTLRAQNIWIHSITIKVEAVRDLVAAEIPGQTAKSIDWEALVLVIHLQNRADRENSLLVLIKFP